MADACFRYEPDAMKNSLRHDLSQPIPSHALRACRDGALTAFAQLATFKLNASRALISVFDRDFQYVVAEATPSSTLDVPTKHPDDLWLCGTALRRADCICDHVLQMNQLRNTSRTKPEANSPLLVSVITDLTEDPRFQSRRCMNWNPNHRFYAGVPIRSPRGIDIGVLCVFDDASRANLDERSMEYMRHLSRIIMEHLEAKKFGNAARRNIRMVRGLGSFVEGYGSMSGWADTNASAFSAMEGAEGGLNAEQQLRQSNTEEGGTIAPSQVTTPRSKSEMNIATTNEHDHSDYATHRVPDLAFSPNKEVSVRSNLTSHPIEDHFLPQVKQVFSKAANIVRESIEVEGVLFRKQLVLLLSSPCSLIPYLKLILEGAFWGVLAPEPLPHLARISTQKNY